MEHFGELRLWICLYLDVNGRLVLWRGHPDGEYPAVAGVRVLPVVLVPL